ncbi:MAG: hypothetical protein IJC13_00920 [Clostridia bacterium]|nr:hypothetical protein [Clostridia bacterium]
MKMRKLLALVLTVTMVMSILSMSVSAEDTVIPISECGGVISSKKTYSISTKEEFLLFEEMNKSFSGATIVLTNDIIIHDGIFTIDENHKPLYNGTFVLPESIETIDIFKGTFDGQGYTISGLYVKGTSDVGFFQQLTGTVKNLNICNSLFISTDDYANVGTFAGITGSDGKIANCLSSSYLIGCEVGGIAGLNTGNISDCLFNGFVIARKIAGGVVASGMGGLVCNSGNSGTVYSKNYAGGFAGRYFDEAEYCFNTGKVFSDYAAGGFICNVLISKSHYDNHTNINCCYQVGEVNAPNAGNFCYNTSGNFSVFYGCRFVGTATDKADYNGFIESSFDKYYEQVKDPLGMPVITLDPGVYYITDNNLKRGLYDFVVDTGNENNGYPLPTSLQRRTVAPSITNVEYEKSSETRNTFNVTVEGRPAMIQFIEPTDGTRTYDRNHKNVTIKSYDAEGNEVNSLDRTAAYEVWSIYSNMMPNVEIRTRAKYLSNARYTWDSETYDFSMILANPIVSMKLSATSGKKGPVPATVVADDKTEKVMFKMPNGTSVTVASTETDENGNKIFKGNAWMNEDGLNEIEVKIYRKNVWKTVGTLEYTVE